MNSENIKKVTNQAIEQLVVDLNEGHSEALTRYLGAMAKFRAYSFLNVLLILKQCPNAGRVAGYKTWQSFGRQVKKGEKGIMILAPMYRKQSEKKEQSGASRGLSLCGWFPRGLRLGRTADRRQRPTPDWQLLRAIQMYISNGLKSSFGEMEWSSHTLTPSPRPKEGPRTGKITLLPTESPAETFATLVHEVASLRHALWRSPSRRLTSASARPKRSLLLTWFAARLG